ncbi:MAG: hypothetical protein KDI19_16730 [Pseudomonadales bacterium]|nr:hypothetical protein [Pseudomonadales bacterium]
MAKIDDLTVGDLQIEDGALTEYYENTGTSTSVAVTVTHGSPNFAVIYAYGAASGDVSCTRTRGSKNIGILSPVSGQIRSFCIDEDCQDGDVYTLSGFTSGSTNKITVVVRKC